MIRKHLYVDLKSVNSSNKTDRQYDQILQASLHIYRCIVLELQKNI